MTTRFAIGDERRPAGRRRPERLLPRRRAGGAARRRGGADHQPHWRSRFQHVVLTQDWHPPGHQSFASTHPGQAAVRDDRRSPTARRSCGRTIACRARPAPQFHDDLHIPHAELVLRKGYPPRRSIPTPPSTRTTTRRRPGSPAICASAGSTRVFLAGLALDFCVRYSAEDAHREGFAVVVIEDACRGIDVDGSVAATRRELRRVGYHDGDGERLRLSRQIRTPAGGPT